eukprot:6061141-Amphidinium_carterae.1
MMCACTIAVLPRLKACFVARFHTEKVGMWVTKDPAPTPTAYSPSHPPPACRDGLGKLGTGLRGVSHSCSASHTRKA